jgi:hypothetical protein
MQSYQILVIIGAIVGIPIMIADLLFNAYLVSNLKGSKTPELSIELIVGYLYLLFWMYALNVLKIALYVAPLIVTFSSKNLSFVGIFLIICSAEILIIPPDYGAFGFPLLLAGGIIAFRKENKPVGKAQLILITIMVLSFGTALLIFVMFSLPMIQLVFVGVIASTIFGIKLAVDNRCKKKNEIK